MESDQFFQGLRPVARRVAYLGMLQSLAQLVLRLCSPGVPDTYWGSEVWDLTLVDPDNRRPVDFRDRPRLLAAAADLRIQDALTNWPDGTVKLLTLSRVLGLRQQAPQLFKDGSYVPLTTVGARADNVIALARNHGNDWIIAVVTRLGGRLLDAERWPPQAELWQDTELQLPAGSPSLWQDVLANEPVYANDGVITARDCLQHAPIAVLTTRGHETG
jgi:(1->4)-alpha-D-glucan 1-alpha-D-glucosylmutase